MFNRRLHQEHSAASALNTFYDCVEGELNPLPAELQHSQNKGFTFTCILHSPCWHHVLKKTYKDFKYAGLFVFDSDAEGSHAGKECLRMCSNLYFCDAAVLSKQLYII